MSLLGWPLIIVLSTITGAATVATLVLWQRVRGPRPVRVLTRAGLLLLGQVSAVLLVAAAINNYGYFYGSWADLVGISTGQAALRHQGGGPVRPVLASGTGVLASGTQGVRSGTVLSAPDPSGASLEGWSTPAEWATRGRVQALVVAGAHSGLSNQVLVYLPPQYFQPAYATTRFPAVEVLAGYPGVTRSLVDRLHYPDHLLAELQAHRAKPMVLVMLRPTVAPPRDTECTDVPAGPLAMTYLSQDLPTAVEQLARVRPTGWGVMGDSTGGYCATKIAMTHSDVFTSAAALSGYYHTLKDTTTGDLWGGSSQLRQLNDPEWLLRHQPPPPVSVLLTIGLEERGSNGVSDTRTFLSLVHAPMSADAIFQPRGGHNFGSWERVIPTALDWMSRKLA